MARSVSNLKIGVDSKNRDAFLLPKGPYVDRVELVAATVKSYTIPSGCRRVVFFYAVNDYVYVRVKTDTNLATASGDVSDGEAAMINPIGLAYLEAGDIIQFISATAGAVHILCGG